MSFRIYYDDLNEATQEWIFVEVKRQMQVEQDREVSNEEVDDYINRNNLPAEVCL